MADPVSLFPEPLTEIIPEEPRQKKLKAKPAPGEPEEPAEPLDGLVEEGCFEEIKGDTTVIAEGQQQISEGATQPGQDEAEQLLSQKDAEGSNEDGDAEGDDTGDGDSDFTSEANAPQGKPSLELGEGAKLEAVAPISLQPLRVLEAALFLANKPMSHRQMQDILQMPKESVDLLLTELKILIPTDSAVELNVTEHGASLQLKPQYLHRVANLSKEVELSRKSMRILALVAKKKEMLQSDLKHFFKGEIYAYVTELKQSGYIDSKRHGNTRKLKPTTKFYESFQVKELV